MPPNNLYEYYYNSPMRMGILCWYPFERTARVLDKTNHALTSLLEERCASVVEGEARCDETFDYIVVIDPVDFTVDALKDIRAKLKPHGRLLMAYENPFALRYWSGKRSPYTGVPYDSILRREGRVGKSEMQMRLKRAGFEGQKWYYPLTDHWFTRELYSDDYLPGEYLNQRFIPYLCDDEYLQFDERLLYREVIRGGAFPFMCGAYLVEARACVEDTPCPVDYAAVTVYRDNAKRFATTVRSDGTVHKIPLHKDGQESLRRTLRNHEELAQLGINVMPMALKGDRLVMPRINLPTLWDYWAGKLVDGTFCEDEMTGHFDRVRASIYQAAKDGKCYWEMVPANCFYDAEKDEMIFFDQEYYWEGVTPDVAVIRALWALKYSPAFGADPRTPAWLETLKARYNLKESWNVLEGRAEKETREWVFGTETHPLEEESKKASDRLAELNRARKKQGAEWMAEQTADLNRYRKFLPIVDRLKEQGFKRPAIYGYGIRGKTLSRMLREQGIEVTAIMDRQLVMQRTVEDMLSQAMADILLVSIRGGEDIAADLREKVNIPVYTLEALLDGQS